MRRDNFTKIVVWVVVIGMVVSTLGLGALTLFGS
jgi:hypothetical protein